MTTQTPTEHETDLGEDLAKLVEINRKRLKEQAIWFLNSSPAGADVQNCERVWLMHKKCEGLSAEDAMSVDEFTAHRVLESSGKPCTINELRAFRFAINPEQKRVSLAEILIFAFDYDWREVVNAPDTYDWQAEKEAQENFDAAKEALEKAVNASKKAIADAEAAKKAEEIATKEEAESSKAAETSRQAEAEFSRAQNQSEETLAELGKEEESVSEKRKSLEQLSEDGSLGIVKRNRAKAELAALLTKDPTPLRTAKLRQQASFRKLSRASTRSRLTAETAETAVAKAAKSRNDAQAAQRESLKAAAIADETIPLAREAFKTMEEVLDEIIKEKKAGKGTLFYIERELEEAKTFLPKKKLEAAVEAAENAKKLATPTRPDSPKSIVD